MKNKCSTEENSLGQAEAKGLLDDHVASRAGAIFNSWVSVPGAERRLRANRRPRWSCERALPLFSD
jgi:hypothetical protein